MKIADFHQLMRSSDSIGTGRLVLGTVQFGLPYGVANTQGQVSFEQAKVMLKMARNAGIDTLDTAIAYGEAETVLGQIGLSDSPNRQSACASRKSERTR